MSSVSLTILRGERKLKERRKEKEHSTLLIYNSQRTQPDAQFSYEMNERTENQNHFLQWKIWKGRFWNSFRTRVIPRKNREEYVFLQFWAPVSKQEGQSFIFIEMYIDRRTRQKRKSVIFRSWWTRTRTSRLLDSPPYRAVPPRRICARITRKCTSTCGRTTAPTCARACAPSRNSE